MTHHSREPEYQTLIIDIIHAVVKPILVNLFRVSEEKSRNVSLEGEVVRVTMNRTPGAICSIRETRVVGTCPGLVDDRQHPPMGRREELRKMQIAPQKPVHRGKIPQSRNVHRMRVVVFVESPVVRWPAEESVCKLVQAGTVPYSASKIL